MPPRPKTAPPKSSDFVLDCTAAASQQKFRLSPVHTLYKDRGGETDQEALKRARSVSPIRFSSAAQT